MFKKSDHKKRKKLSHASIKQYILFLIELIIRFKILLSVKILHFFFCDKLATDFHVINLEFCQMETMNFILSGDSTEALNLNFQKFET